MQPLASNLFLFIFLLWVRLFRRLLSFVLLVDLKVSLLHAVGFISLSRTDLLLFDYFLLCFFLALEN